MKTDIENIINGWEYTTSINPNNLNSEQKLQDSYLLEYNLSYHKFLKSLCIDKENLDSIVNDLKNTVDPKTGNLITKHRCVIDTYEDNDIINGDSDYPIKFLKHYYITL